MDIIGAKEREVDLLSAETVYDGPPDGHKWSSQATFITRQNRETSTALARAGRRFDNLYIRKKGNERWHLFSSQGKDGHPPILFYFSYDAYGFKSYVYVGWLKLKTQDFVDMDPAARDQLLTTRQEIDIEAIWKKDRSIDNIGFALEAMPRSSVDAAISRIAKKLKTNASGLDVNQTNINRISSVIASMKRIGTPAALELANTIEGGFKDTVIVALLKALRDDREPGGIQRFRIPSILRLLRTNKITWPELDVIERSFNADESRGVRESDDWITPIHSQVIKRAEIELLHDVPDGNYWTISRVIQNLKASAVPTEMAVRLLTKYKQDILEMQAMLLADEMVGVQAGLSNMVALLSIGIDWSELRQFIEENKTSIMRTTLWDIAHSNEDMYQNDGMPILYGDLVKIGVRWPEMAIIAKSIGYKA